MILRFQETGIPNDLVPRNVDLSPLLETKNAVVISGPRRAGKTYFMFQIMKALQKPIKDIVYINFEDNVLVGFLPGDFEDILRAFKELYPHSKPILFLDEVHIVPQWELFVRKLVDTRHKVFVTGSYAEPLSREYATKLGGRYLEQEIFPLSFKEFLRFKDINFDKNVLYSDHRYHILDAFEEYVTYGGFPEVTLSENPLLKEKLLDSYFKTAFFRDIVDRFKIRDGRLFEIILKKAAENVGQPFSFRSILNKAQNLGYKASLKTIVNYFELATRGYLLLPSYLKRESVVQREKERKFYFIDNGYLKTFFISANLGRLLENAVATNLYFATKSLHYFRNKMEIDFVLEKSFPVQVVYNLSDESTFRREIQALIKYLNLTGQKNGLLLTWNEANTFEEGEKRIQLLPAWYYLLFKLPEEMAT